MRKFSTLPVRGIALAGLLASLAFTANAQTLKPLAELRTIETEHFEIIYPAASRPTAELLASFADKTYAEVSGLLGISLRGKLPVTITPHTDEFNGYYTPVPYPHIVLYDTPMSIEWTTFRESLKGLFTHELTHAVSLSSRGKGADLLYRIFGGWVLPVGLNCPYFMTEGVTVSFESLDGFGRANDPLIKEELRQAIREGDFLTPFQVSGVFDYPKTGNFYTYGGLFSSYLQKRFGMAKYAELWARMGREFHISLDFNETGFFKIIEEVYGFTIRDLWADFADSLRVDGLEENDRGRIASGELKVLAMASDGKALYWLDSVGNRVIRYDSARGAESTVLATDGAAEDFDISPDGSRILVSGFRYAGELATAWAREYSTANGRTTGREWKGLYRARYFGDGLLAITSERHNTDIVSIDKDGVASVLLRGNDSLLFSSPAPVDGHRFAVIASEGGIRKVLLFNMDNREAQVLRTDLADDLDRWRYARDLRASGGKLWLSYDHDDRFYKLAMIDLARADGPTACFAPRDISGGVFTPTAVGGELYYRGKFARFDAVMRYPESSVGFTGTEAKLNAIPWIDMAIPRSSPSATAPLPGEKPYSGLSYLNPFKCWIPWPLIASDGETTEIQGGGIYSYLGTPTDMNAGFLMAAWNSEYRMAAFDLSWDSQNLGIPVSFAVSDGMEFGASLDDDYRAVRASATLSLEHGLGSERVYGGIYPSASVTALANDPKDGSPVYNWKFEEPAWKAGGSIGISSLKRYAWQEFASGAALNLGAFTSSEEKRRATGLARLGARLGLPMRATAYGIWDESGLDIDGSSRLFGDPSFSKATMTEYSADFSKTFDWVAGGELEFLALSLEAQTNISHLYVNRLFATVGWHGAFFPREDGMAGTKLADGVGRVDSLVARIGAVVSALPVQAIPYSLAPYCSFACKLENLANDDRSDDWLISLGLSVYW